MKTLIKLFLLNSILLLCSIQSHGQIGLGSIEGTIIDSITQKAVPWTKLTLLESGDAVVGCTADFNGVYNLKAIRSGTYQLQVQSTNHTKKIKSNLHIKANQIAEVNFQLVRYADNKTYPMHEKMIPIIERDRADCYVSRKEADHMCRETASVVSLTHEQIIANDGPVESVKGMPTKHPSIEKLRTRDSSEFPPLIEYSDSIQNKVLIGTPAEFESKQDSVKSTVPKDKP